MSVLKNLSTVLFKSYFLIKKILYLLKKYLSHYGLIYIMKYKLEELFSIYSLKFFKSTQNWDDKFIPIN